MSHRPRLQGAARAAERRRENLDMFIGVLGFFTLLIFVSTAVAEIRGEQSLGRALVLAVFVVLMLVVLKIRKGLTTPSNGTTTGSVPPRDEGL